ncbi:hypothetical protein MTO96_040377 [Rhipicephalus appendiculatus]
MLKITLLLLLCTAVISAHTPDLFKGCVLSSGNRTAPHTCIIIPKTELGPNLTYYTILAEGVLQKSSNQLHKRFLNTVYKLTRAATEVSIPFFIVYFQVARANGHVPHYNIFWLHVVHDLEWLRHTIVVSSTADYDHETPGQGNSIPP